MLFHTASRLYLTPSVFTQKTVNQLCVAVVVVFSLQITCQDAVRTVYFAVLTVLCCHDAVSYPT